MKWQRIAALLCALVLLASMLAVPPTARAAEGDTVYVRKHVSLLYDNSGSMSMDIGSADNLKWCYASYAAQVFTGLLNDMDSLTVTFMNPLTTGRLEIDLTQDRQQQVRRVLEATAQAKGGTPLSSVYQALEVLTDQGLLSDAQLSGGQAQEGEQFWLVLTTDGNFNDDADNPLSQAAVEEALAQILEDYSNLHLVYFGIGAAGDTTVEAARDLRGSAALTAYPNFSAVYAEKQEEIVSTMQALSNQISGRYGVSQGVTVEGSTVTLEISGESSPIRNVAVLAQETGATLLSAQAEDGAPLRVTRSAGLAYPENPSYDNLPAGTLGGCTAMISAEGEKIPVGTVKLTFSQPVAADKLSLMYEPAIYVSLTIQQQDGSGDWTDVPLGKKLLAGQTLRVQYAICEDGSDTPLDESRLPGKTEAKIACGGQTVEAGEAFQLPEGSSVLSVGISMMDGAYCISTSRTLQAVKVSDFSATSSGPVTLRLRELEDNETQHIDFTVTCDGEPADASQLAACTLESGDLQGQIACPGEGVVRFTPRGGEPGDYQVRLLMDGQTLASETVTVEPNAVTYTAQAAGGLALFSNALAGNTESIAFTVTAHSDEGDALITAEDAELFRLEALGEDGAALRGKTAYQEPGTLLFTPDDGSAPVGDYTVTLWYEDQPLAQSSLCIMQYNATYTAEVFLPDDGTVQRYDLYHNQTAVAFVIYADGVPCTSAQLAAMLEREITVELSPDSSLVKTELTVGQHNGTPAVICRPTSTAKSAFGAFCQRPLAAWGGVSLGDMTLTLRVDMEKGTEVSGTLQVVDSVLARWFYRLLPFVILALLVLLAMFVFSNLWMPRIKPGVIHYYQLRVVEDRYVISNSAHKAVKGGLFLRLLPKPQEMKVNNLTFTAKTVSTGVKKKFSLKRTARPSFKLSGPNSEVAKYYNASYNGARAEFLEELRLGGRNRTKMMVKKVAGCLPTVAVVDKKTGRTGGKELEENASDQMDNGGFLMRKGETLEIWAYAERSRGRARNRTVTFR